MRGESDLDIHDLNPILCIRFLPVLKNESLLILMASKRCNSLIYTSDHILFGKYITELQNCKILKGACLNETFVGYVQSIRIQKIKIVLFLLTGMFPKIPDTLLQTFIQRCMSPKKGASCMNS